jgi:aspartyl aminopeptidase
MKTNNAWKSYASDADIQSFSEGYRPFLDMSKTERECVRECIRIARESGFVSLEEKVTAGAPLCPGDRVYISHMNKALALYIIGEQPLEKGMNILGAHIDSPRIDIKQNPLYEDTELVYLDTHYYGGIKKYQWVALPLALHGVVVLKTGETIELSVGEDPADPVLCITDLLPHLAADQMKRDSSKIIEGEDLNILLGSRPENEGEEKEAALRQVLRLLKDRFGIEEEDFISAELEIVPAGQSRDAGLDRSMILGYGHDDRCCAYPSLKALCDLKKAPSYTACTLLVDKEEIGSTGATGMDSRFFENATAEVLEALGSYSDLALRRCLAASRMLSSDVSAGFDPLYASAFEKKNSAYLGHGVCFNKYTGSRGKSHSNDANAEFVAQIRRIMEGGHVTFQTAELGRVDQGGGGTIAYMCARYGMQVIDCGIPVLSMHAPWETISKVDLFEAYKAYGVFLNNAGPVT